MYKLRGFSNTAINVILKSWRPSTIKQYVVYAKLWFSFSSQGLKPTVRNISEFLVHLHSKGFNHSQISQARSAIGVISGIENLGKHPDIKRVMKGLFELKPIFPKYSCVWDVRILFNYFRSLPHQKQLPLNLLTKKLATLLCILAGGQRSQTIHAINALDLVVTSEKCIVPIYCKIKQTRKGAHMRPLEFKVYQKEEKLCVIQNLAVYLKKTRSLRQDSQLFLSYQKPHHPVSKDTITRWVNDIMSEAGIDTSKYVTHSCRSAASSFAHKQKVALKKIVDSCGWSSEATFARHYHKEITDGSTIAECILGS